MCAGLAPAIPRRRAREKLFQLTLPSAFRQLAAAAILISHPIQEQPTQASEGMPTGRIPPPAFASLCPNFNA